MIVTFELLLKINLQYIDWYSLKLFNVVLTLIVIKLAYLMVKNI